jgi:hypothetical protein
MARDNAGSLVAAYFALPRLALLNIEAFKSAITLPAVSRARSSRGFELFLFVSRSHSIEISFAPSKTPSLFFQISPALNI